MTELDASYGLPPLSRPATPAALPEMPTHHGIVWRPLSSESGIDLQPLVARIEATDNPPYRTSGEEIAEMLSPTRSWTGIGAWMTRGIAAGEMVAYGIVATRRSGQLECVCNGGVDPRFRGLGLGRSLIAWQTAAARNELDATGRDEPAQIVMHVDTDQDELEEHLTAFGYHWARSYYELRARLSTIPEAPAIGPFLSIVGWTAELDEPTRRASNRLSELEWGRPPQSEEQWLLGRTDFVPEWSFIALDRTSDRAQVVGFLLASAYRQDWPALGWREGYIDLMGVMPRWRNAGVADALVVASMRAQGEAGMDQCATGVGSANHSGAIAVYQTLGFHTVGSSKLYAINV